MLSSRNSNRHRVPRALRSSYALLRVFLRSLREPGDWADSQLEREYHNEDPWNYRSVTGQRRFARELRMIDSVTQGRILSTTLEIGCGEGQFTEQLSTRTKELLAVDMNELALERTRCRCECVPNVKVQRWDLRHDAVLAAFDLVVVTSVLEYVHSRQALGAVRSKLVASVRPGGWLLVGNVQQHEIIERAAWDRYFLRGAGHVNGFVGRHPELTTVAVDGGDGYLETMFSKRAR